MNPSLIVQKFGKRKVDIGEIGKKKLVENEIILKSNRKIGGKSKTEDVRNRNCEKTKLTKRESGKLDQMEIGQMEIGLCGNLGIVKLGKG